MVPSGTCQVDQRVSENFKGTPKVEGGQSHKKITNVGLEHVVDLSENNRTPTHLKESCSENKTI